MAAPAYNSLRPYAFKKLHKACRMREDAACFNKEEWQRQYWIKQAKNALQEARESRRLGYASFPF